MVPGVMFQENWVVVEQGHTSILISARTILSATLLHHTTLISFILLRFILQQYSFIPAESYKNPKTRYDLEFGQYDVLHDGSAVVLRDLLLAVHLLLSKLAHYMLVPCE